MVESSHEYYVYWDNYGELFRGVLADLSSPGYVKLVKVAINSGIDVWEPCAGFYVVSESILRDIP
jgi:hypothetical protein